MSTKEVLLKKAKDAQVIYDYLCKELGLNPKTPVTFLADETREKVLKANYLKENPFPHVIAIVLAMLRKNAVNKIFETENIYQTATISAVLSLCSNIATEIGELRGDDVKDAVIYSDIAFSGLQAIRLYMANYTDRSFKKARLASATRVDNAINGSFHKYRTRDKRYISFHTYYQSQQEKLVKALKLKKSSEKFTLMSTRSDVNYLNYIVDKHKSHDLEELAFECGACASILRTREEWEATEVGKAVCKMPLIKFRETEGTPLSLPKVTDEGPLSGIKVLDFTHIIAGPAATRILAEYGADVLLVRRGKYLDQEQSMLELDGWAGKRSIQLDLNNEADKARCIELIKEANVITYSYQNNAFDKFGLSIEEIKKINPEAIVANLMCFSDTVWKDRPGWAPLAEDITGLSIRNGSIENPANLNGVPLDYIPGFVLALGILMAIKEKIVSGKTCQVSTSLTRGAMLLHEVTDVCDKKVLQPNKTTISTKFIKGPAFKKTRIYVENTAVGKVGFPGYAVYNTKYNKYPTNMPFTDGNTGFKK